MIVKLRINIEKPTIDKVVDALGNLKERIAGDGVVANSVLLESWMNGPEMAITANYWVDP